MRVLRFLLPLIVLIAVTISCDDDAVGPGPGTPSLDSLWPNEDGTEWSYWWLRTRMPPVIPATYESPDAVPEVPSFDDAYELLVNGTVSSETSRRNFYELSFDGTGTTESGAEGQVLDLEAYFEDNPDILRAAPPQAALMAQILRFRPDLATAIQEELGWDAAKAEIFFPQPLLLHGGIFEKTEEHIGTYGDVDQELAWMFLNAELEVGSEFQFQLVPSLASDVWLHGQIRQQGTYVQGTASYSRSLECLYVVDYGIAESSLGSGEYYRQFSVGTIVFAPLVGPIYSQERIGLDASLENTEGWTYHELSLLDSELPPTNTDLPAPTLANIWPDQDGNAWDYLARSQEGFGELVINADDPLPSMDSLYDWVAGESAIDSTWTDYRGYFRLEFDGMTTTESGVRAKNLEEWVYRNAESQIERKQLEPQVELVRRILRARPDLEDRARKLYPKAMSSLDRKAPIFYSTPFLLLGGPWERTTQHIGFYGDYDQRLVWKLLESDLDPGHRYSYQLLPELSDDLWMHVEVWRDLSFDLQSRRYDECIEVFYVFDLGVQIATDEGGEEIGRFRSFTAGTIVYAPTIGPIFNREREYLGGIQIRFPDLPPETTSLVVESSTELVRARLLAP